MIDAAQYPAAANSTLNYGVPALAGGYLSEKKWVDIERMINLVGAQVVVQSWSGTRLTLSFEGVLAGQTLSPLVATVSAQVGSVALDTLQTGSTQIQDAIPAQTVVVDYAAGKTDLSVLTGPVSQLKLDMDGSRGALLEASGHMSLDVFGFVQLDGNFALQKSTLPGGVTLSDNTQSGAVSLLTLGASNVSAFAGLNGGTEDAMGLQVEGMDFGLALIDDRSTR